MTAVVGPSASKLVALTILVSNLSATNSISVDRAPCLLCDGPRSSVLSYQLARVHPRFRTPAFAVVASFCLGHNPRATGTFEQLLTYVVFTGWLFYALAPRASSSTRRKASGRSCPTVFRLSVDATLLIAAAVRLVLNTIATHPGEPQLASSIVFVGTPAYFIWRPNE